MLIQGIEPPRADRKEPWLLSPVHETTVFEEFIRGLFQVIPSASACRAYRASFLPLHWSAASNWRSEVVQVSQLRERGTTYEYNRASYLGCLVSANEPEGIVHPHGKSRNATRWELIGLIVRKRRWRSLEIGHNDRD
ncbi:hypothetical protein X777_08483 [Ooceraea biroi]|uniref:Uncharacterized protein n=1 Tax=Ooceraea biroi TaxID=2015173 RepID=A0A026W9X4_OOCBI|nr:hypothetical protein X777_08483 [Ooceraea biroi]